MPTIDPLRLKTQLQQCFAFRSDPTQLLNALIELLENYSDRAYRPSTATALPSPVKSFHVPPALLRAITRELANLTRSQPAQALSLAQMLWEQPIHECKQLGIAILENLPLTMHEQLFQTLEQWVSTSNSPKLAELIAQSALTNFQLRQPVSLLEQTQKWLRDERVPVRNFGFLVLEQVSLTISFQDFPLVLKVISPYLKRCPPQNFAAFTAICNNLITKSPKEMAHLMRTVLQENPTAQLKKLIRSCLKTFPPELQKDLLTAIQERT